MWSAQNSGKRLVSAAELLNSAIRDRLCPRGIFVSNPYTVELTAPDISAYKAGNTGIDYVHTFDSGMSGPHAMINAAIHGNEICGAIALDLFLREGLRPTRGKLTLCFVNPAAYVTFNPERPSASRFVDEDMNRVWTEDQLDGPGQSVELARARTCARCTTRWTICWISIRWAPIRRRSCSVTAWPRKRNWPPI